jgi:hypothetical protein
MISQRFNRNKHKRKKGNPPSKTAMGVMCPDLGDEGGAISSFVVEEGKLTFAIAEGGKKEFFLY